MIERPAHPRYAGPEETSDEFASEPESVGSYWDVHKEDIRRLFDTLGQAGEWSDDPEDSLPMIRRDWIGSDHGSNGKKEYSEEQAMAALPILDSMGLIGETVPPPGHVDEVLVPGGRIVALDKRLASVKAWMDTHGVTADRVVILAGQRRLDPIYEGTEDDLLSPDGRFGGDHFLADPWASQAIERGKPLYETDLARMMMIEKFGMTALVGATIELHDVSGTQSEQEVQEMLKKTYGSTIPPRVEKDLLFDVEVGNGESRKSQRFVIVNGKPAPRKQGSPRPTTISTALEWLERQAPRHRSEDDPSKVIVLTGNPYTRRSTEEIQLVLDAADRNDIELIPAGTAASTDNPIKLLYAALGEVGRIIDNDYCAARVAGDSLSDTNTAQAELLRRIAA